MSKEIITEKELTKRLDNLGESLSTKCNDIGGGIVFICVMKGGFMFFSDLIKRIKYPIEVDFVRCSSYEGQEQKKFALHYDVEADVTDKTVYLVDDIFDSGNTIKMLTNHFKAKGAKSVTPVVAVYKENVDFPTVYHIYKQPKNVNPWYIGYGMDGPKGYSRNLKTINIL